MRTEKQIYDTILNFAKADDRIRVVTLEGSRTNINIIPDDFQDYDITFLSQTCRVLLIVMSGLMFLERDLLCKNPRIWNCFQKKKKGIHILCYFGTELK